MGTRSLGTTREGGQGGGLELGRCGNKRRKNRVVTNSARGGKRGRKGVRGERAEYSVKKKGSLLDQVK